MKTTITITTEGPDAIQRKGHLSQAIGEVMRNFHGHIQSVMRYEAPSMAIIIIENDDWQDHPAEVNMATDATARAF